MAALDKFVRLAALKPVRVPPALPKALRAPQEEDSLARLLGAGIGCNQFGEHVAIRTWYSTPEFAEPSPATLDLLSQNRDVSLARRTRCAFADPAKWLFLDTETTGLAGGTGTYAFLVGLAWWDAGGLQVEQLLLRDFSEEHSVLHELAQRIAERPALITFNGKTFDWPLLENRFTMTRSIPAPRGPSGPSAPRARSLEIPPRLRASLRTRAPGARPRSPRLDARRRHPFRRYSTVLF